METEIISTQEIDLAKNLATESNLELTLKTSGCSAVSDIFLTEAFDIKNILTPMIESSYALEKFLVPIVEDFEDKTVNDSENSTTGE